MKLNRGFTLIEVLVASLILFITITTMMLIYRGAMLSSIKAEDSLSINKHIFALQGLITQEIRATQSFLQTTGEGTFGILSYRWEANPVAKGRAQHPDNLDFDLPFHVSPRGSTNIYLWHVNVWIEDENKLRTFSFQELSW